ncbi:class I SAM-dependent methyltransferase [Synechococcus sp. CS-1324]|uniref:class I SAM-dependent methyltransferase n=1 Tax=Synechococcus sp. CS-1324 TaxID=2847980 RepID=UPI000DB3F89D|nr:class I SAM-dependent methyltransferase [Synechococcus sp. CS-1324]MCT0229502.1 class I SAM-dependent methyltransferase [Synechococcus sp. CS-1324]PZV04883.1 MAG: hypothetical protein DCF23_05070 [Cyanobium sp.]
MNIFPGQCPPARILEQRVAPEPRQQSLFADVCSLIRPGSILEIGSWMGASAMAWCEAAIPLNADAKVYCVDTWLGSVEHYLNNEGAWADGEWGFKRLAIEPYGPTFFDDFLWNVHANGYADQILPFRADSQSALSLFANQKLHFDVIYVDGAHDTYSVFKDVSNALKIVSPDGLICGDDFGWETVRDGLVLAAVVQRVPFRFLVKGQDFIVLRDRSSSLETEFIGLGYRRWHPLAPANLFRMPLAILRKLFTKPV